MKLTLNSRYERKKIRFLSWGPDTYRVVIYWDGKIDEGKQFKGENHMFSIQCVTFEIVIRHLGGDIKQITKYSILNFRRKMKTRGIIWGVRNVYLVDEHLAAASIVREKKQFEDWVLEFITMMNTAETSGCLPSTTLPLFLIKGTLILWKSHSVTRLRKETTTFPKFPYRKVERMISEW